MDRTDIRKNFPPMSMLSEAEETAFLAAHRNAQEHTLRTSHIDALSQVIPLLQEMLSKAQAQQHLLTSQDTQAPIVSIQKYNKALSSDIRKLERCFLNSCNVQNGNPFLSHPSLMESNSNALEDIQILIADDAVTIRLPYLPGRGYAPRSLIFQLLNAKLHECRIFPSWPKWSAAFYHVYGTKDSITPRDVDNYDIKKAIDLIALRLHTTDNPTHFHIAGMQTIFTDEIPSGSYIRIKPKSSENSEFENFIKSITSSELSEKTF